MNGHQLGVCFPPSKRANKRWEDLVEQQVLSLGPASSCLLLGAPSRWVLLSSRVVQVRLGRGVTRRADLA